MEKYFEKLIEDYEKVLVEELGEGKLKTRLLNELEIILSGKSQESQDDLSNNPLDYDSLYTETNSNQGNHNLYVRIQNALKGEGIKDTNTLTKACYKHYRNEGRSWKNEKTYNSYLNHLRNLGKKSIEVIIFHLKSKNFDFSEKYAKKTFGKIRSSY